MSDTLIHNASELTTAPQQHAVQPKAKRMLMVQPTYFHVDNPINPHMRKADGSLHTLDKQKAMAQWQNLKAAFEKVGVEVTVCEGGKNLPDMVFCANQCLPFFGPKGEKRALLSNMANEVRHQEVPLIAQKMRECGYSTETLPARSPKTLFEGMGDALWLPGHRFLLGGYGHRTSMEIYSEVASMTQASVAVFELVNPRFYHLDTCLCILDSTTALACRDAFTAEGWALLKAIFPKIIEVDLAEADSPQFACNAHCPDEKHVFLQPGSAKVCSQLSEHGFVPVECDTSEFIKSGGSVFCMKLMFF
jgi:N-dimethylarginine dimethylaminohydrolase